MAEPPPAALGQDAPAQAGCGAVTERRRGDACRSTVMQTASKECQQNGACPMLLSFCAFNPSPSSTSMHTSDASAPNSSLRRFDTSFLHEAGSSYASPHRLFFGAETGRGSNADKAFIACPSSPCSPSAWRLWLLQRACHPCKPAVSAHWNNSPTNRGWGVRGEGGGGGRTSWTCLAASLLSARPCS